MGTSADSLSSSHVATADVSSFKAFNIKEKVAINFRAEAFDVFNIQNYGVPADTNIGDPQAGVTKQHNRPTTGSTGPLPDILILR